MAHPRPLTTLALALLLGGPLLAQGQPPRFVSQPDVRGNTVVFTLEGDIWSVPLTGGNAQRLTSHPGLETAPRLSPDGKWIAFSGSYDGGVNVYLMPVTGGAPRRLTWRGQCQVQGWTPDSKAVLFRAALEQDCRPVPRVYQVDLEGHEPSPLPVPRAVQAVFGEDAGQFLFSPKGNEEYYWKRYKGGQFQEIWLCDRNGRQYRRLTDYVGKNAHPMWAGGKVLFVSDRGESGIANLYSLDPATREARPLTDFKDFDVQWPACDGQRVVFVQGGRLQVLELATGAHRQLAMSAASDDWAVRPRSIGGKDFVQGAELAADGRSAVLEVRGDVFLLPLDKARPALNLTASPGVRERFPSLSPDGTQVAYFSDESGEYDLYLRPAKGGAARRLPTGLKTTFYRLAWSPDGKKLLFGDKDFTLRVMDVASGRLSEIDRSRELKNDQFFWEVSDYAWAPDSRWIAYSQVQANRNNRIFLYNLETRQKVALTDGFFDSLNPVFDPAGDRLYFLSYNNFATQMDPSQDNHIQGAPVRVMAVRLRAEGPASPSMSSKGGQEPLRIEPEGLRERITALPVKPGNYFHLQAGQGLLAWDEAGSWDEQVNEDVFNSRRLNDHWKLDLYDTASEKLAQLNEPVSQWSLGGGNLLVRRKDGMYAGPWKQAFSSHALPERLDADRLTLSVAPRQEWLQIFNDTWRWYRDFFYDTGMHGRDWAAIGAKFKAWVPDLHSRSELNWLLSQMVGELSVSHTYVGGGDLAPAPKLEQPAFPGLLGADLSADASGLYRFDRVYGPTAFSPDLKGPLCDGGNRVREGEYLLAVDGVALKAPEALYSRLQVVKGQKVKLTVNAKPVFEGAREVEVEPLANDGNLRYERWVAENIAAVEKRSGGALGYLHLTAMGEQNIGQFDKFWRAFRYRKGLVVDVRGNGGGWTEFFMIDKLERKQVGFNVLRGMEPFRYPGTAADGRYVFLSNEQNGSDGEAFLSHVKARKLGSIVGVPSWGGLVGIVNTQYTIDGGTVEQSNNAFYGQEGKWWVENHGADPDLVVENDPASALEGHDRQLEVAVDTLMQQLKDTPTPGFPAIPAYPNR